MEDNFLIRALTPKDTEEVKPGVFLKQRGDTYRQVYPAVWKGKINWRNLILGPNFTKGFITFIIFMFIVLSYSHDVAQYKEFYEDISNNPNKFCVAYYSRAPPEIGSPALIVPIDFQRGVMSETKISTDTSSVSTNVQ